MRTPRSVPGTPGTRSAASCCGVTQSMRYTRSMNAGLLESLFRREIGYLPTPADGVVTLSGWQVVELLWPLNERFRPLFQRIATVPYNDAFSADADTAIERMVFDSADWADLPAGVWRVLLERQQQMLRVALANEMTGTPLMSLPAALPHGALPAAAMLFWLHGMRLPFPPADRSGSALPPAAALASLRPH